LQEIIAIILFTLGVAYFIGLYRDARAKWRRDEELGRVRPEHVKRLAQELLERFPERFTTDFENNKKMVDTLTNVNSAKLRNRVAGYIIRLIAEKQER
jgi:small subunit ribosomal protein S17e